MIIVYSMIGAIIGTIIGEIGMVVAIKIIQIRKTTKK